MGVPTLSSNTKLLPDSRHWLMLRGVPCTVHQSLLSGFLWTYICACVHFSKKECCHHTEHINIYMCLCTLLQERVLSPYWAHKHIFQHLAHLLPINKYHRSLLFFCALVRTTSGIAIFPDSWQVTLGKVKTSCADTLHDHSLLQTLRGLLHTSECQEKTCGNFWKSLYFLMDWFFPRLYSPFVCLFLTALVNHSLPLPIISVRAMTLFFYLLAYFKKFL